MEDLGDVTDETQMTQKERSGTRALQLQGLNALPPRTSQPGKGNKRVLLQRLQGCELTALCLCRAQPLPFNGKIFLFLLLFQLICILTAPDWLA